MDFGVEMVGENAAAVHMEGYILNANLALDAAAHLIQEDFHAMSARRFGAHGPGGEPLTATTVAIKARRGMPQPETPMYGTGELMFSLAGHTGHTVFEVRPDEIIMGTSVPYARYHQQGPRQIRVFGRGHATLPQRKVVDVTEADAARWAAIIAAAMRGAL